MSERTERKERTQRDRRAEGHERMPKIGTA
jgi:hypothetical protein